MRKPASCKVPLLLQTTFTLPSARFDVFGYFYNESNGQFFEVLNETGDVTDWKTVTFTTSSPGDYRFVFVAGSYDGTGGEVLGASLSEQKRSASKESSNSL